MAFDRNNPVDLLALKNEVNLDPLGMGYDPLGINQPLLDLLNLPANNLGLETGPDLVTANRLLRAIFPEAISAQDQFKIQLAFEISAGPDSSLEDIKDLIGGLSTGLQAAVDGVIRSLSRAEVLFSASLTTYEPVIITLNDWFAARES